MPDPIDNAYRRALELARQRSFQLTRTGVQRLYRSLADVLNRLTAEEATGIITSDRAERLAREAEALLRALQRELILAVDRSVGGTVVDIVEIHRRITESLLRDFAPSGMDMAAVLSSFDRIPVRALAAIASRPNAATYRTLINRRITAMAAEVDLFVESAVARGVSAGRASKDLARLMARDDPRLLRLLDRPEIFESAVHRGVGTIEWGTYGIDEEDVKALRGILYDARRIMISEPNNAHRAATAAAMDESPIVVAAKWQLSGRHFREDICDMMASADAHGYGAGFYPPSHWPDAPHPHCFVPETEVQGSFVAGFRSNYDGDVVRLRTRAGNVLTVTPNHPILTPAGFVPAGSLREGDQVLSYRGGLDHRGILPRLGKHEQQRPALIREVFATLAESAPVSTRQLAPEDLHGDARFTKGDVHVVGANRILLTGDHTSGSELPGNGIFEVPAVETLIVDSSGATHLPLPRFGAAALRLPGGTELAANGLPPAVLFESPPVDPTRFGGAAYLDASLFEPAGESEAADRRFLRELEERFSGLVAPDEIVEVGNLHYSGHVYDLTSEYGFLTASNVLVSNCGCYQGKAKFRRPSEWDQPKPPARPLEIDPLDPAHTERWAARWSEAERERYQTQFAEILVARNRRAA